MACKEEIPERPSLEKKLRIPMGPREQRLEQETCWEDVGFFERCDHCNSKKRRLCVHSQYGPRKKTLQEPISPSTNLFQSPTSTTPLPSLPSYIRSYSAPIFSVPTRATAALFRSKTDVPRASNSCMKWKGRHVEMAGFEDKGMKVDSTGFFPCMEIGKHGQVKEQLQTEITAVETEVGDGGVVKYEDGKKCSEKKGDKEERQHGTFEIRCVCGRVYSWSIN